MTTACRRSALLAARFTRRLPKQGISALGFTLIELMVVLLLVALGSSLVVLSLRDTPQHALDKEADRLISVLESARAQARSRSTPLLWQADEQGYAISPAIQLADPAAAQANNGGAHSPAFEPVQRLAWMTAGTRAEPAQLWISAEPVQAPLRLQLTLPGTSGGRVRLGSNGAEAVRVVP